MFLRILKFFRIFGLILVILKLDDCVFEFGGFISVKVNGISYLSFSLRLTIFKLIVNFRVLLIFSISLNKVGVVSIFVLKKFVLKIGDRVFVSGIKIGIFKYIGVIDFVKGDWVGVELDEK